MKRSHWHPATCKVCGAHFESVGTISQTGLCPEHSLERMVDNLVQLKQHSGPRFDHWRRRIAASVGASIPERG